MTSSFGNQPSAAVADVATYEERLAGNARWALSEGSRHFDEKSAVFAALRKITARLDELGIPYAVVGGMALFRHGYRRFTEDVDLLVTREDLKTIHEKLEGLGYLPPHRHSKHLRDTELGVRIEFLTTGEYPGDGKPKPVAFPSPADVRFEADGISYVELPVLMELKLASGMTNPGRLRDLSDVMELIRALNLPADFADRLNPFVRDKYTELWRQGRKKYVRPWRNKPPMADGAEELEAMRRDGVSLNDSSVSDDYALLVTTDPDVARKYDMVEESEFWAEGGHDETNPVVE
jgi:Uncharacterised nucleotidyltransferase